VFRAPETRGPMAEPAAVPRTGSRLRILIAEDNPINLALATGILEKCGHSLVHAANGREAVAAVARESFDLILMDVQMPEMDGLEATRRIRETEQGTALHTPIVALTAHAMPGDRERCLAAGMDDYLSKPMTKAGLLAMIARIPNSSGNGGTGGSTWRTDDEEDGAGSAAPLERLLPIYTREKLLEQIDGDEQLLQRMIALFQQNTPRLIEDIRGAVGRRSSADLARAAHALLSSLGAFGADGARRLTKQLEAQAQAETYADTARTFAALERETAEIHATLAAFTFAPVHGS